ncbi:LysR family transcriptional regulator, partial [Marinobacter adhaerens]
PSGGTRVWREVLDWVASPRLVAEAGDPIPLVLSPAPDVYRKRALSALDVAGRDWRIVYTSPSLAGLQAAVQAGLGVTVLPTEMV